MTTRIGIPSRYRLQVLQARGIALTVVMVVSLMASLPTRAAAAGDALQLRQQALAFEHGEGVVRDPIHALALYCESARLGDVEAQFNAGWMYANGRGIARDDASAAYFFKLAADQGHVQALHMLGLVGQDQARMPECMQPQKSAATDISDFHDVDQKVLSIVQRLAPQFGVSPRLAIAVIRAESNFNGMAVSPKNAQGLMQLIPDTSVRFNVRKPFDPEQNIRGGLAYLRWLLAYFKGDVALVAAAYNSGEGTVNRFRGIPPYDETRGYVKRIMEIFHDEQHPYDASVTDPSPELPRFRARKRST